MIIMFLMISGACAGSTGGGLKVSRILILLKNMGKELHLIIHPEAIKRIRLEGKSLDYNVVRSVSTYLIAYCFVIMISVFLISFDGFDFTTNFTAVSATFNNIGPDLESRTHRKLLDLFAFLKSSNDFWYVGRKIGNFPHVDFIFSENLEEDQLTVL